MKKRIFIITVTIIISFQLAAQDWQCIHDSTSYYYIRPVNYSSMPSYDLWAVKIDSISFNEGYKNYYGFRIKRTMSDTITFPFEYYCVDPFGPSRMSIALSVGEAGNFFYNSTGDGIRFRTDLPINVPWICCRITDSTRLDATVTQATIDSVLGVADSVKYISLQARRITGEPINHPLNNQVFKVSKHFGMITLFDFYRFPEYDTLSIPVHNLIGYATPTSKVGDQNLTSKQIYSMSPGDEFHILYMSLSGPHGSSAQLNTVKVVLDSTWSPYGDTVLYTCRRLMDYWLGTGYDPHHYTSDTITELWTFPSSDCIGLDNEPDQTVFCPELQSFDYVISYSQYRSSEYNYRWVKKPSVKYLPSSLCADTLCGYVYDYFAINSSSYFIEGCGSGYYMNRWTDFYGDTYMTYNLLKYFRKGNETWGTPFDTTGWNITNLKNEISCWDKQFWIYPNPANDIITIKLPWNRNGKFHIEIVSLEGSLIEKHTILKEKPSISISRYSRGMYILKLYDEKELLGQKKFIKT